MLRNKFMMGPNSVDVVTLNDATALDELPPQVYTLHFHEMFGFSLIITKELLSVPPKIYGNAYARVEKCIQTYVDRENSTGVLLTGDKGTGKSVVMSLLANSAITDLGLPVILIKSAHEGEQFNSFIESLGECCLVFDEIGKMYKSNLRENGIHQESLLTLLDGVDKTKRFIIMTENQEHDISEFMLNRPSRIYYHFKYKKLDEESIKDYCEDFNVGGDVMQSIVNLSRRSRIFSFDMLQTIVEEHLRFKIPIDDVIKELNIDIRKDDDIYMSVVSISSKTNGDAYHITKESRIVKKPDVGYTYITFEDIEGNSNTVSDGMARPSCGGGVNSIAPVGEDEPSNHRGMHISTANLVYESNGNLVYEEEDVTIACKELPSKSYDYYRMF